MPPQRKYRVRREDLEKGAAIEANEHPEFKERTHRRLARDHLQRYGPGFYRNEKKNEQEIQDINKRIRAKPRRAMRRPDGPFFDPNLRNIAF